MASSQSSVQPTENIFLARNFDNPVFIGDASLDAKTSGTCDLFLLIEKHAVQLTLKERRTGKLLAFELLPSEERKNQDWKQLLESTSAKSKILRNYEFSKVTAGITSANYTLVPEALFKAGDETLYFRKNFSFSPELNILAQHVPSFHLYCVFGTDIELENELNHLFQDPQLFHHSQALLTGLNLQMKSGSGKQMWLNVRRNYIDIVVAENKKLILMNSFSCQTNEDILYYTLFVCEQLELNPDKLQLSLTGEIEDGSALYLLLFNYIQTINVQPKPGALSLSFDTDETSFHHYATLYNLALCE